MRLEVGARSDVGRVREANEDSYLIDGPLFVVADGMGGHIAGDVASSTAVEVIEREASNASNGPDDLARLVTSANAAIWDKSQNDSGLQGMGTTCTIIRIDDSTAYIAHVGDSRAYRLRGGELDQVTEDHTLVGRMVREGRLRGDEAMHHPQRSIITRALGVDSSVQVDTDTLELRDGDRLLLCSDGLVSMVEDPAVKSVLVEESDPQRAADRLVELANERGGEDNITVIVVDVTDAGAENGSSSPHISSTAAEGTRTDTEPGPSKFVPVEPLGGRESAERGRGRRVLVTGIVVVGLLGAGWLGARWALDNSFYVSVDESEAVTIFRGIPEEIAGLELSEVEERPDPGLVLEDLPETRRPELKEGVKAESLDDARAKVANLSDIAQDFAREQTQDRQKDKN